MAAPSMSKSMRLALNLVMTRWYAATSLVRLVHVRARSRPLAPPNEMTTWAPLFRARLILAVRVAFANETPSSQAPLHPLPMTNAAVILFSPALMPEPRLPALGPDINMYGAAGGGLVADSAGPPERTTTDSAAANAVTSETRTAVPRLVGEGLVMDGA